MHVVGCVKCPAWSSRMVHLVHRQRQCKESKCIALPEHGLQQAALGTNPITDLGCGGCKL